MRSSKYQRDKGFTLIELIILFIILAVIAVVAVPRFLGYQNRIKEQVCRSNRRAILREYELLLMDETATTLTDYFALNYTGDHICPKEGIITAVGEGDTAVLICSFHGAEGIDTKLEVIPHTGGIKVTKIEKAEYLAAGETVYHDGKYYVCINEGSNPLSSGNAILINTESEARSLTDEFVPCSLADFEVRYGKINSGDMILYKCNYYVLRVQDPSWMQYPGQWPWLLIKGQ